MMGFQLTIDIVDLSGPEKKQDKEIPTTQKGDQENQNHGSLGFLEHGCRNHRILGESDFPYEEGNDKNHSNDERYEDVIARPWMLATELVPESCM